MNEKKMVKIHKGALKTVLFAVLCLSIGVFAFLGIKPVKSFATDTPVVAVTSVQLRADVGTSQYYLVLNTNEYGLVQGTYTVTETAPYVDLLYSVRLYLSETDTEGVLASAVCSPTGWKINQWGSAGLMIPMTAQNYEIYNGASVYKISVEKDTIFPNENGELKIIEDVSFINQNYGNQDAKYGSFNWLKEIPVLPSADVEVFNVQLRADVGSSCYYLVLQVSAYAELGASAFTVEHPEYYLDTLDKISLYTSKDDDGILLSEICLSTGWVLNKWTSHGVMFPIGAEDYEQLYNGTTVYKVTVEEGAVLPYVNSNLTVIKTTSFINSGYQNQDAKYQAFSWSIDDGVSYDTELEMAITGVQLRADPLSGLYYFVVRAENYATVMQGQLVSDPSLFDVLSKIKIYTSKDGEGVLAKDVCLAEGWEMNRWESHGIMFPMTAEKYALYNATTVYKVEILEGAVFPGDNCKLTVTEGHIYLNLNYGDESARDAGFTWSYMPSVIHDFGSCTLTDMNNRSSGDTGERWLFLFFTETFESTQIVSAWIESLNALDYIEFYPTRDLTQTPISLREVYTGNTTIKQFGQNTAMTFSIDELYSGKNMYMLRVKPGCQIPYIENGRYGYRVVENGKSFTNDKFDETGDIFGLFDEKGMPRTYENWGVWWTSVRQVTFTVKGIEGLSYPSKIVAAGDVIDLKDFEVKGYKVTLTTLDGDRCIGGYIVPDKDVTLVITYEKLEKGGFPWYLVAIGGALATGGVVAVLLLKKKGGVKNEK